jgi:MFS family permease
MPASRVTVLFLNLGHLYDHLFMLIFPTVVLTLERDWHRPYGALLTLGTAGFVAFGAGTLPAGWLGDRWTRSGMMSVFFLGIGAAAIATGLAATPLQLALGLAAIGIFASIYHPVGIAMVVEESAAMGKALGVNGVWGNLGVAFAAFTAAGLSELYGWRAAFILPGIVSLATGIAFVLHTRRRRGTASQAARRRQAAVSLSRGAMIRVAVVVLLGALCAGLVFNAATVVLPKLFAEQLGPLAGGTARVGAFASAIFAVAALAQVYVGHLLDRYPIKPLYVVIPLLQAPLLLLIVPAEGWPLLAIAFLAFVFIFGAIPLSDWMVGHYASQEWRARIYAVKQVMSFGVSALTLPIVGFLHDRAGGFSTLMPLLAALAFAIAAMGLFLPGEPRGAAAGEAAAGD